MLAQDETDETRDTQEHTRARRAPRFQLMLRQARVIGEGEEYVGLIRDISSDGAKVQFLHRVPTISRIKLEVAQDIVVGMARRWESETTAGYQFDQPIDIEAAIHPHDPYPKRRPRYSIPRVISVAANGRQVAAQLLNLSLQGACLECDLDLARFQMIRLSIDGFGDRHAKVRWRKNGRYGLVLEETLELRDFARRLAGHQED